MNIFFKLKSLLTPFRKAFGPYKVKIIFLAILGLLSGLFEAVGVNALIPLFSFINHGGAAGDDIVSKAIVFIFSLLRIEVRFATFIILIAFLFFLKAIALLIFNYIRIVIRSEFERERREALLRKMLAANWSHLLTRRVGYLETLLMVDVSMSAKLFEIMADSLVLSASLVMYLLVALNISWLVTLSTILIGGIFFVLMSPILHWIKILARKTATLNKEVTHLVGESTAGLKTIKAFGITRPFLDEGCRYFDSLRRFQVRSSLFGTLATVFVQPVSVVYILIIFAIMRIYDPDFSFVAMAALAYLVHRIFTYIQTVQSNLQHVVDLAPYLHDTTAYEEAVERESEENLGHQPFSFIQELTFERVCFAYTNNQPVLNEVSFKINHGTFVGIIGISGAGKTTLFDLLLRLFRPTSGEIRLDGVPIHNILLRDWRANLGYVPQDVFLLNDTIENNIRFFNLTVTTSDIREAAKLAHLDSFIQTLPDGYQTLVGERGARRSAGQRPRVGIARALARKPIILLLDEVTSALDGESELEIQRAIEGLKGQTTILVIAHRLSTIVKADKLVVLKHGRITEEASPEELLKDKKSYFYRVYNNANT